MGTRNRKLLSSGNQKILKHQINNKDRHTQYCNSVSGSESSGWLCACMLWLLSLILYIYTLYPSIPGGDSGELITAAQELGVAHPPGYPLFTVLAWLCINLLPVGSVAWRVNLLTALLSSLAALCFALTINRVTKSKGSAIIGISFWCFSKLTWTWSITAEVFGMNNLFVAMVMYLMVCFQDADETDKTKLACVGAFVCALSLCNQHTMVLYVGIVGVWVLWELWSNKSSTFEMFLLISLALISYVFKDKLCPNGPDQKLLSAKLLLKIACSFLLGLTPYIYLPLSAFFSRGRWTWGDQRTLKGFLIHVLRQEYGTFNLGKDYTGAGLFSGLSAYKSHCMEEFTAFGILLLIIGLFYTFKRPFLIYSRCLSVMLVMVTVYLLFFTWRANLDVNTPLLLGVVERFWMQSDCIVVLFICLGYSSLFRSVHSLISHVDLRNIEVVIAVLIAGYHVQCNFSQCNQRNNTVVHEFGSRLLENMPQNALLLVKGDLPSNSLRYLYLCENMRPDVKLFDQEVMTYDWSVPMMRDAYPRIVFPGHHMFSQTGRFQNGTQVFNFETFLDANNDSPIIACIGVQDHDDSWQKSYTTFPYGPCQILVKTNKAFNVDYWIKSAQNISAGWKYPFNGFEATTWERVATDEMWQAKISIAFALYDHAVRAQSIEEKSQTMLRSYELYSSAISEHPTEDIPSYWHKNYALVCQQLLSLQHSLSREVLVDKAIFHYETFIKEDPTDENYDAIVKIVQQLKTQREHNGR